MSEDREHIFITKKYFDGCDKYGLYGVSLSMINSLSLVNEGDICYILQKPDETGSGGYLYGPYDVISDPFYDSTVVWEDSNGEEKYSCKVRIKGSDHVNYVDIYQLTDIIESNNLRLQTAELKQYYNVITMLPKDQGILEREISKYNQSIRRSVKEPSLKPMPLDSRLIFSILNRKINEKLLEYLLMRNPPSFLRSVYLLNQFRLSIMQDIVDVIGVSEDRIVVVELKDTPRKLSNESVKTKLDAYARGCGKLRTLLAKLFKIDIKTNARVEQYLISAKLMDTNLVFIDQNGEVVQ